MLSTYNRSLATPIALCLCLINGAAIADKVVKRAGQPDVHMVKASDPLMNVAIKRARKSVARFINKLQQRTAAQTYFSVKAKFTDNGRTEHIWLSNLSYRNGRFHGQIGNKPVSLRNISYGDRVSVDPKKISDWMIIENKKLIGGYTIRVLRNRLPAKQRAKFDQSLNFKIE